MNRINNLFKKQPTDLLSVYFCAGYPEPENTTEVIRTLEKHGVDLVEIGIPFSDPMADGPVIQQAATQSLKNGMSLRKLFGQLKSIREEVRIPLILMGYLNPILQYGFEAFCKEAVTCGIDGCIIPDLPFADYQREFKAIAAKYNFRIIMLITPETSDERLRLIDEHTDGFIYMVSSASTTGAKDHFDKASEAYFNRIADLKLNNPRLIGFGISNQQTFRSACDHASGAIIGSKFVSLLGELRSPEKATTCLLEAIGRR